MTSKMVDRHETLLAQASFYMKRGVAGDTFNIQALFTFFDSFCDKNTPVEQRNWDPTSVN